MKKLLLETSFSKIYMIAMIIITLLILGGYFSYAMFTVSKERGNAISIVTGNLTYDLKVDGSTGNTLTVPAGETKTFTITLSNPNNIKARFNFYYVGSLPSNVTAGYITGDGVNTPPLEAGTNLEKINTTGSSNTYTIRVSNKSGSSATITLGVSVGLDYNDLSLPSNGHLFEEIVMTGPVSEIVIDNLTSGDIYDDGTDTFITGEYPNNYIWYSGKLWRAVSVNNEAGTTKLVTQWNISAITYNEAYDNNFKDSYIEEWLNDTTVDGFLGNLREPEKFIVMDAKWNATMDERTLGSITRPTDEGTIVTDAVGLLNTYEYQTSYRGAYSEGYLNNGLYWWTLTPTNRASNIGVIDYVGALNSQVCEMNSNGIRPTINLKSNVRVVNGDGTSDNPYRLEGDDDVNLSGTFLNTRYSGEYIKFGMDENNLYRIVSHETDGLTKVTSAEPLKSTDTFIASVFGSNTTFSSSNTIGTFLNGEYLTSYVGNDHANMIENSTTWYLGTVSWGDSYKLAKYTDTSGATLTSSTTNAKVGLLRMGELMAGQFNRKENNTSYWTLTLYSASELRYVDTYSRANNINLINANGVRPSMNLKQNVVITSGDGTKNNPFTLELAS